MRAPYSGGRFRVTSPYGARTIGGAAVFHAGIDLVGLDGDKTIVSPCSGRVAVSAMIPPSSGDRTWEWGNYVRIDTNDGYSIYLCHLDKRLVKAGDAVKPGTPVGIQGNTGLSYGEHCHFELRRHGSPVDPSPFLAVGNEPGAARDDDAGFVCRACGFIPRTREYVDDYLWGAEIWRKIRNQLATRD